MKHILLVSGLLLVFLWMAGDRISSTPFGYDEADYVYAASQGFWANYTDTPAQSLAGFVRVGLSRGRDQGQRLALSESIRGGGDINFYRHWHGPMYYYWLMGLLPWNRNEQFLRMGTLILIVLTSLTIYLGSLWILPGVAGRLAAVLGSALFLFSTAVILSIGLAPHQMFALWSVVALLFVSRMMTTGERRYWYGAVAAGALAFATLEVAFVLLPVLLICAWREPRLAADWRLVRNSLVVFTATVLVVWPAALLKLSFLKAYLFMVYLALFRKAAWGDVTFLQTWRVRLSDAPVEWLLLAVAVVVWWRCKQLPGRRQAAPFLLYGGLMLLTLLRVYTTEPRYLLPLLPALHVFAGITLAGLLARWRPAWRYGVAAALCLMLSGSTWLYLSAHPPSQDPRPPAVLTLIRERRLENKRLLAPHNDLPMLHYYFPQAGLTGYLEESPPAGAIESGRFDAVVYPGLPLRIDPPSP